MQSRKTPLIQKVVSTNSSNAPSPDSQHGSLLLRIPLENLAQISSDLDPRSLLALGQVNVVLYQLVKDDHTWHSAFVRQYFAVGLEADLYGAKCLLLRRSAGSSWRQEFLLYDRLRQRWEGSRNTTTAHIPLHSAVSDIHLMPSHGLIASSLRYGVVSRSLPFTGTVLRGFLDASGSGTGLGIGNPNTEFTPNVSAIALGSDGGTAKIAWGFRNGDVAFTSANKAMDANNRSAAKFSKCIVGDAHLGVVSDVIWDGGVVVSAAADGRVKVWDPKRTRCVWTSAASVDPDAFVKIASVLDKGIVVAVRRTGTIVVWSGFQCDLLESPSSPATLTIPSPIDDPLSHPLLSITVDVTGTSPKILVAFADIVSVCRLDVDLATGEVETAKFGDDALGPVTSISPYFTNQPGECSLVVVGTQLGCVAIYDWSTPSNPLPAKKLEAYEDASAVTAVAWNGLVLVTGCARGVSKVFDGLTLEHLRTFSCPIPRNRAAPAFAGGPLAVDPAVRQILLGADRETMFVAVGDHVLAWRAGPVPKGGFRATGKNSAGKKKAVSSKAHHYLDMRQEIAESKYLLKEEGRTAQRAYGRECEQRAQLDTLGLDEVEAVEYVLMLSREEAIERERAQTGASTSRYHHPVDEGVFEADFDADPTRTPSSGSSVSSTASSSPPRPTTWSMSRNGRPIPRASTSPGNESTKIQVSPPLRVEPTKALFSPPPSSSSSPPPSGPFPPISSSASPPRAATKQSAWSTPLTRSPVASPTASVVVSRASSSSTSTPAKRKPVADEDDEDLQLAIALSLSQMQK